MPQHPTPAPPLYTPRSGALPRMARMALTMKPFEPEHVRAVRVRDTAHLDQLWVSATLLGELPRFPALAQVSELQELAL